MIIMSKWCKHLVDRSGFFSTCYKCKITGKEENVPYQYDKWYCYDENRAYSNCPLVKNHGWYITSTTCDMLNKKENDPVMEKHIWLRENIIEKDKKYEDFIDLYNMVGPIIKDRLENDEEKEEVASQLYLTLSDIVDNINDKEYDIAARRYILMTLRLVVLYKLQEEYRISKEYIQYSKKIKKTLDK